MSSGQAPENGKSTTVTSASGRPLSQNKDAVRKREARAGSSSKTETSAGGHGGGQPSTKGNPMGPDALGVKMGEPIGKEEAKRQLYYAHVGIAKVIRSQVDMETLDEEFDVAGENYAYVANHIWTPLRVVLRFVAPVVLVAALLMIWGAMIAETPWIFGIRNWWQRRSEQQHVDQAEARDKGVQTDGRDVNASPASPASEPVQTAPPIPRRPTVVKSFGGLRR